MSNTLTADVDVLLPFFHLRTLRRPELAFKLRKTVGIGLARKGEIVCGVRLPLAEVGVMARPEPGEGWRFGIEGLPDRRCGNRGALVLLLGELSIPGSGGSNLAATACCSSGDEPRFSGDAACLFSGLFALFGTSGLRCLVPE